MSDEEQIILPEGYTRVEYLLLTKSQWIKTGVYVSNNLGCKAKYSRFQEFGSDDYNATYILCAKSLTAGQGVNNTWKTPIPNSSGTYFGCSFGAAYSSYEITPQLFEIYEVEHNFKNSSKSSVNDIVIAEYDRSIFTEDNYCKNDLILGSFVNDSLYPYNTYNFWGRIYYCIITEGDKIIRHYIPCKDRNNNGCFYEAVNKTIHYNDNPNGSPFICPINNSFINNNYNLPAGFKKCVYLQSDGTQWIDTGVIPDNETGLYFKALQLSYGDFVPFGVTEGSNGIHPPRFNSKNLYYKWGGASVKMMTWDKADDLIFHSSLNLYNSKIAKFDSKDTDVVIEITSQAGTYTIPIRLFSYNFNGSYSATYGKWGGRIYRAQITQETDLIHDYVPCLDADNRPCMYDLIEQEALYNQSGGTEFAYCVEHQLPSDFVKLKYLESTGTQYIKTGYIPTNNTGLYIDALKVGDKDGVPMGTVNNGNTNTDIAVGNLMQSDCRFHWNKYVGVGGSGKYRFESSLNWLNDKKSIIKTPISNNKINTLSDLTFTPNRDFHIFGWNLAGTNNANWDGRIYRAKISEGTEIVRDFVPALDQRNIRPCMYDLINNVAYYNDGSGEFLYNRDFEGNYKGSGLLGGIGNKLGCVNFDPELPRGYKRVAYLESTGTQFINTELDIVGLSVEVTFRGYNYVGEDGVTVCGADAGASNRFIITVNWNNGVGYHYLVSNAGEYSWSGIGGLKFGDLGTAIIDSHNKIMSAKSGNKFSQKIIEDKYLPTQSAYCHLFTRGSYLTGHRGNYNAQAKIYSFKANYAGVPAANYIPCLDHTNKPCMFDLITQQPFYNKGNGEDFKYGLF